MNLQVRPWNDNVCIYVVAVILVDFASYALTADVAAAAQFLTSRGSVILPVTAEAATTIGEARYVLDST